MIRIIYHPISTILTVPTSQSRSIQMLNSNRFLYFHAICIIKKLLGFLLSQTWINKILHYFILVFLILFTIHYPTNYNLILHFTLSFVFLPIKIYSLTSFVEQHQTVKTCQERKKRINEQIFFFFIFSLSYFIFRRWK